MTCRAARGEPDGSGTGRRLQSDMDSSAAVDQLTLWNGYQLAVSNKLQNWAVDETDAPEQARYVGAAPGRNKLVAGLFLHATRKAQVARCTGGLGCQLLPGAIILPSYLAVAFKPPHLGCLPSTFTDKHARAGLKASTVHLCAHVVPCRFQL